MNVKYPKMEKLRFNANFVETTRILIATSVAIRLDRAVSKVVSLEST
jgi:hypothetical protein